MKRILALLLAVSMTLPSAFAADKIKIEKLDDLPRHTYKIDGKAVNLFDNEKALLKLANEVKKNLEADLEKYDIQDKTTLKGMYADLGTIAMLNNDPDTYLKFLSLRKQLEDKEATRLTMGMFTVAYINAQKQAAGNEQNFLPAFRENLKKLVSGLPYSETEAIIKGSKGNAEIISKNLIVGQIESTLQPTLDKSNGEMSQDLATGIMGSAFTLKYLVPLKEEMAAIYTEVIDANAKAVKPDIWEARDIVLSDKDKKNNVVVCVWDSGVDYDIFVPLNQMWSNTKEVAGNNKDDDKNGFIDDVHGIAWGLHSDKEVSLLYPIGDVAKDRPMLQAQMKGLDDIQSAIDSPEAAALKKQLASMHQDSVKPFLENVGKYGNYCHGTHCAGIAARGNPFIRILGTRITFDYRLIPELPTVELAQKEAKAAQETVEYFKKNNVRVVNMSWGGSLRSIEDALEANNWGTPEERKTKAREIYQITYDALLNAFRNAPDILFVTSAGNSNADNKFEEFYPSSFELPNMLTVGAVDQAGEETGFTSFGKVDIYANGFEVPSYVPGGDVLKLSGTSMSSPNVVNLAAKLLVMKPDLKVSQLKDLIIKSGDEKMAGDRKMLLMNPKKSAEMLAKMS